MIHIRNAQLEDCPGLARVQVDSYRTAYASLFPESYLAQFTYEEQEQDWRDWVATHPDDLLLVAGSDDKVSGYLLARAQPDIYPGYDAEILAMHVRQAEQGRGIGSQLLKAAVKALEGGGCRSVMLWTLQDNPVCRWYERLGGKVLGEKRNLVEDWEIVEIAYGWETISSLFPGSASGPAGVRDPD